MSNFDELKKGLEEAIAYEKGEGSAKENTSSELTDGLYVFMTKTCQNCVTAKNYLDEKTSSIS